MDAKYGPWEEGVLGLGWGLAGLAEGLACASFLMSWVNTEFP